jgi:hypothetical protein
MVTEGSEKYPAWLGVTREGGATAQFLLRAGSVGKAEDVKIEGDTISFKSHGREWTGKAEGDTIEGTFKRGNEQGKWTGKRFMPRTDVAGKWTVRNGDKEMTLVLERSGRQVTGKCTVDGKTSDLSDVRMQRGALTFTADGKSMSYRVKGDVLEADGKPVGKRERQWGKPIELFAGKTGDLAANWEAIGGQSGGWHVLEGIMTNGTSADPAKASHKGTENIMTKSKAFKDFKLHVEFMVPEHGNSGVYLRGRYEIQVEDSFGKPAGEHGCGALYSRIAPKVNASKKAGEWQTYDITLVGSWLTVVHNGKTIIDNEDVQGITGGALDCNESEPGPIYLQGDHSQAYYRNVVLTPAE